MNWSNVFVIHFRDAGGEWRWHLRVGNNRIVASSGEGFHNQKDCMDITRELFPLVPEERREVVA